ncbi:hypothetical protein E1263_19990 [Kribbella antibiotica]|uniref:Uncharacterized protein n=1 Tax=Kribbella antibiotica TaxID=190195 RepID=A0A4R4ZI02_9ACTN|nr:hypothetical protein [Kribbella antibiotica]TDD58298.1 hypothetical protein E1263_19990 [Kribbella antibiotica]
MALPNDPVAPEPMVANPERAALTRLRAEVVAAREGLATALDPAAKKMGDGKTWTGPTAAKNWAAELTGRKKNLGPWVDAVIAQIDAQLRTLPDKVTTSEARIFHNDQRIGHY